MSTFKTVGKLMTIADWKYQISLALPENTPDQVLSDIYDIVESLIEREKTYYCPDHKYNPPLNSGIALCPECEIIAGNWGRG